MNNFFHRLAMFTILIGGFTLFVFSVLWFIRENILMAAGMLVMSAIAESNYYLHRRSMKLSNTNSDK